ncbi:MAG: ATP-binding protein [Prevotella sp.]
MNKLFIGREKEQRQLKEYISSEQSEFIAVYGRRRVGKTFLIQQVIGNDYAFYVAGMNNVSMRIQLKNFMQGMRKTGENAHTVDTWLDAFIALEDYLDSLPEGKKIVFIDEMPWMDTPRSNFISGLEHFWNSWASWRDDIKLIVCGSATSWILNNLIKNRGGLHNRVTHKIPLKPFTLKECREYFDARQFRMSMRQIAECYMVLGGVPFYLSKLDKGEGLAQNIDRLLFAEDGELHDEFSSLYNSLYKNASNHIKIVTSLATKGKGLTRQEIIERTKLADNGRFSLMLEELESCGFIRCYEPYVSETTRRRRIGTGKTKNSDTLYQLVDPFTLFYFQVMRKADAYDANYWSNNQNTHLYSTWSGLSFEMLCLNHVDQIKSALGISGISANVFSWAGKGYDRSAQIDMLIDRADLTINLCEMKFHNKPYTMTRNDEEDIERKVDSFKEATKTDKSIIVTMITTMGLERNEHSEGIQKVITLDQLFC